MEIIFSPFFINVNCLPDIGCSSADSGWDACTRVKKGIRLRSVG